jgi:D-amino-acid oxidase
VVGGAALPPDDPTPDAEVAEDILARAIAVEPRLADARVLGREVGWRPVRPTPRTEVDHRGVVHAYGHGGVGVTVSWGVADEVTRLVATVAG